MLPLKIVESLDADIRRGDATLQQLAESYDVDIKRLSRHRKRCLKAPPKSGHELLMKVLSQIDRTARDMKQTYEVNPEENSSAMGHYIKLVRELRETVAIMDRIKPSGKILKQISDSILEPMVLEFSMICVDEMRRLRGDLISAVGDAHAGRVDREAKETTIRMADRFKTKTDSLLPKLKSLLDDDSKAKRPFRRPSLN